MKKLPKKTTFCLGLKNRPQRAIKSITSLVTAKTVDLFDFIVVEEVGNRQLDLSEFPFKGQISHYVVDTGEIWNRSKVLNYAFKKAVTPLVTTWDADFFFPPYFPDKFVELLELIDFRKHFLCLPVTETDNSKNMKRGQLWGGMYTYSLNYVMAVNGYDEQFVQYGHEERDFNNRIKRGCQCPPEIIEEPSLIQHVTHGENVRNYTTHSRSKNFARLKSNNKRKIVKVNTNVSWGDSSLVSCSLAEGK